jgi:hypothetical protein
MRKGEFEEAADKLSMLAQVLRDRASGLAPQPGHDQDHGRDEKQEGRPS